MVKRVQLQGIEGKSQRSAIRIVELFFDGVEIYCNNQKDNDKFDLNFSFSIAEDISVGSVLINGSVIMREGIKKTKKVTINKNEDEELMNKQMKQAMNRCLFQLLQEYTGIIQPWGLLTGIRPTKLYHKMRQAGMPATRIEQKLREDYFLSDEKIKLLKQIVKRQIEIFPDFDRINREVSIYIGIPFCPTKCAYCTFPAYDINGQSGSVDLFLEGLHHEIRETGKWLKNNDIKVTTVYFGGGTPTSISASEMDKLYHHLYESIPNMNEVRELTVEAGRPDTITIEKIEVLKKWKVDRISVNPQSFKNETLVAIGRHHSVEETVDKYWLAYHEGLSNINMDLIIGLPGEGLDDFKYTLDVTKELQPASLTVHTLAYKRASQMTRNKGKYKVADNDEIFEMMNEASDWMEANDYYPYYLYRQKNILGNLENIGYSKRDKESLYNIMIMEEAQTIIGLGCGAASKWVDSKTGTIDRFANPKDPQSYINRYQEITQLKCDQLTRLFATTFS